MTNAQNASKEMLQQFLIMYMKEPPKEMLAIYEYLHKKQIDRVAEVKMLQTMF